MYYTVVNRFFHLFANLAISTWNHCTFFVDLGIFCGYKSIMSTDNEILTAIDAAIIDVLENGQAVTFRDVTYTKANVSQLFNLREKYSQKVSSSGDNFFSRSKTIIPRRDV